MNSRLQLDGAFLSDIGKRRKKNQDAGIAVPELGLFVVADGMGGHQGGEIASQLCVEKVVDHVRQFDKHDGNDAFLLKQALHLANQAIFDESAKNPLLEGMGTTATLLKISNGLANIIQVGDSRAYFWNSNGLWQLTRDHSLVQEKLRAGLITRDQVKSDQMKNVITRSVGYEANVKADSFQIPVESGDGFLLCSDGLSGPLDDTLMFEILEESLKDGLSLSEIARELVFTANSHGGDDNITAVIVRAK